MTRSNLVHLAALVFVAVSFVVIGDTAGKLLTSHGVHPFIVAWTRFGLAAALLLPLSGLSRSGLRAFRDWRVLLRAGTITAAICCILTALRSEPIANVFGAFFIGPVVSYILAIAFLGERPTRRRSLLLALGFAGVMLVVKPGFGATTGIFFALAAGSFYGAYLAMTRLVAGAYPPRLLLISQLLIGSVILTPVGLSVPFPDLSPALAGLILLSALGSALGNFLLVLANKSAEASLIAPLVYTQLLSATIAGVLVFGDWPDFYALAGLILIAASGLGSLIAHHRAG
ncbi:MAG: DMT family transporter [Mangrovicoccus sp.]|nr:DMT family transporter [Mangrovicoccus sp.]